MTPEESTPTESQDLAIRRQGHHPTCEHFTSHIIQLGSRSYCAGCTGLGTGAIFALIVAIVYFFLGLSLFSGVITFWSGFFMVFVGLSQHLLYRIFRVRHGWIRVFMNIIFVVGSSLLLVGVTELTNNLVLQGYLLLLILYWVFTRIVMSKRTHYQICVRCNVDGCSLSEA
jgi:hypothetical protein